MLCRVQKYFQMMQAGGHNFYIFLWNTVEFPADVIFACTKAPRKAKVLGEKTEDNLSTYTKEVKI